MYRSQILVVILCFCIFFTSYSQNDTVTKPPKFASPLMVYVDSTTKSIYWPMDLPFWVKLSTSDKNDALSFMLDQYSESPDVSGNKKLEQGIKLKNSGKQFIRWLNSHNGKVTLLKFYSDGEPPVVRDTFYGAPVYIAKAGRFFGSGLKYAISAKDALAGIDSIKASLDNLNFVTYKSPFELDTEKEYKISSYAVDKVGYASSIKTANFIVDKTPPVSAYEIPANYSDDILSVSATIKLHSIDKLSGVKSIFYKFDNQQKYLPYFGQTLTLGNFIDGNHVLSFFAVDNVNNKEEPVQYDFYLDRTPPVTQIEIEGDNFIVDKNTFLSPRSLVRLTANDKKTGVKKIQYMINAKQKIVTYENPFPVNIGAGNFTLSCFATDQLDNTSQKISKAFVMDPVAPKTDYKITGPKYQQNSAIWITKETDVEFYSIDKGAGLKNINYQIGNDKADKYEHPVRIQNEGRYVVKYWGVDNVDNVENSNAILLIIDNTKPDIKHLFSVAPIDSITNKDGKNINSYPQYASLFLAATDQSAGVKSIWYSINGGPQLQYHNVISCDKLGDYTVKIRAEDNVGHYSEDTISFLIKAVEVSK